MKKVYKVSILCFAVLAVAFLAHTASAAQNSSYPHPTQCRGADWNIGNVDGVTCTGSVSTGGAGSAMENDSKANSVLGSRSRLSPDVTSLNKFCQQYTGESNSYAWAAAVHNFCSACDQQISWWTGSSWQTSAVCAGTLNVQLVHCKTGCTTTPACTPHVSQKCVGNAVYWFNSCNQQEELAQTCAGNQTCQNGQCVNVSCSSNYDCGTDGYVDSPYCQSNNVYQNYKTFVCNNPGTSSSSCSSSVTAKLKTTCSGSQTCSNGSCVNQNITCSSSSDCGTSGYIDSPYCQGNSVYQNYRTYTCNNAGTAQSYCSNSTNGQFKYACTGSQTCSGGTCSGQNYQNITVETRSATNVSYNNATLNGYLYYYDSYNNYCSNYVWFEYGPTASYGNETTHQTQNYSGAFSQNVNLYTGYGNYYDYGTYHYRAVAQLCNGNRVYGNDTVFYSGTQPTSGYLTINTTVKNQTSGSANFSNSVYANPSDTLLFLITIQATGNQDVQNVFLRDALPANLVYKDQLIVSCSGSYGGYSNCLGGNYNYSGNITSGINLGTIYKGQTVTVSYQAQVAPAQNFSYGTSTLSNNVYATSSGSGYNPVTNASVLVTRTGVYGASYVPTGLTNNFWVDSFFLPLLVALIGVWMWRAGMFFWLEKWIDNRKKIKKAYKSEKELNSKISAIKNSR